MRTIDDTIATYKKQAEDLKEKLKECESQEAVEDLKKSFDNECANSLNVVCPNRDKIEELKSQNENYEDCRDNILMGCWELLQSTKNYYLRTWNALTRERNKIENDKINNPEYNDEKLNNIARELVVIYNDALKELSSISTKLDTFPSEDGDMQISSLNEAQEYFENLGKHIEDINSIMQGYYNKIANKRRELRTEEQKYQDELEANRTSRQQKIYEKFNSGKDKTSDLDKETEVQNIDDADIVEQAGIPSATEQTDIPSATEQTDAGKLDFSSEVADLYKKMAFKILPFDLEPAKTDAFNIISDVMADEDGNANVDKMNLQQFECAVNTRVVTLGKNQAYKNILRASIFALKNASNGSIEGFPNISKISNLINEGKINMKEAEELYKEYKEEMLDEDIKQIKDLLVSCVSGLSQEEIVGIEKLLSKESSCFKILLDKNATEDDIKTLLNLFWRDFGHPEYAQVAIDNLLRNKFIKDNISFDDDDFE